MHFVNINNELRDDHHNIDTFFLFYLIHQVFLSNNFLLLGIWNRLGVFEFKEITGIYKQRTDEQQTSKTAYRTDLLDKEYGMNGFDGIF